MTEEQTTLSDALDRLAGALETAPIRIVGQSTNISIGAPVSGTIIGEQMIINAGGNSGRVVGKSMTMTIGDVAGDRDALVRELRDVSEAVKSETKPAQSWVNGVIKRAAGFSGKVIEAAVGGATAAATAFFLAKG